MTFPAVAHSTCAACDGRITPGEHVLFTNGHELVHVNCDGTS